VFPPQLKVVIVYRVGRTHIGLNNFLVKVQVLILVVFVIILESKIVGNLT
jgi:hypothetical protein